MKKKMLKNLAEACGRGDADSMLSLSEYLQCIPYDSAANMWLLRAAVYGNTAAQERVREEMAKTSNFLRASLISYEYFILYLAGVPAGILAVTPASILTRRGFWHSGQIKSIYYLESINTEPCLYGRR